jgi:hypothetical protein
MKQGDRFMNCRLAGPNSMLHACEIMGIEFDFLHLDISPKGKKCGLATCNLDGELLAWWGIVFEKKSNRYNSVSPTGVKWLPVSSQHHNYGTNVLILQD